MESLRFRCTSQIDYLVNNIDSVFSSKKGILISRPFTTCNCTFLTPYPFLIHPFRILYLCVCLEGHF